MITDVEQRAVDGEFGDVLIEGQVQNEIRNFTGALTIEQRAIRVAGTQRTIFRRGPIARTGSFTLLKVDSTFESLLINYSNLTPTERRTLRGQGIDPMPEVQIAVLLDDPDSWGAEEILLQGCKFWTLPIGYDMNSTLERNMTVTWDQNQLMKGIPRPGTSFAPPPGAKTWAGAGNIPLI